MKTITEIIQQRRAIFPQSYNEKPIADEDLVEILDAARWAPSHRLTQPWRFMVFKEEALQELSTFLGNYYKSNTPKALYSEMKYQKTIDKPMQSACVLGIIMKRDDEERVPEWEEVASVAMAVQNMWLVCTDKKIGSYWSSPKSIVEGAEGFLKLQASEKCLGLFYMGHYDKAPPAPDRKSLSEIVDIWEKS